MTLMRRANSSFQLSGADPPGILVLLSLHIVRDGNIPTLANDHGISRHYMDQNGSSKIYAACSPLPIAAAAASARAAPLRSDQRAPGERACSADLPWSSNSLTEVSVHFCTVGSYALSEIQKWSIGLHCT